MFSGVCLSGSAVFSQASQASLRRLSGVSGFSLRLFIFSQASQASQALLRLFSGFSGVFLRHAWEGLAFSQACLRGSRFSMKNKPNKNLRHRFCSVSGKSFLFVFAFSVSGRLRHLTTIRNLKGAWTVPETPGAQCRRDTWELKVWTFVCYGCLRAARAMPEKRLSDNAWERLRNILIEYE